MPTLEVTPPSELEISGVEWKEENITLAIKPAFYGSGRAPTNVAVLKVKDDKGQVVHLYVVRMSARDLGLSLMDRTTPVKAVFERAAEEPKK